jgi:hypothetical protein
VHSGQVTVRSAAYPSGGKPALVPLPTTSEHEAYRAMSRSNYDRSRRTPSEIEAEAAERMNTICDLISRHGGMRFKEIRAIIGCTRNQADHALRRLRLAGRAVFIKNCWTIAT